MKGIAYDAFEDGHRRSYLDTWARELGYDTLIARPSLGVLITLLRAQHVIFSTLDDVPLFYLIVGILRSCIGRRTVGIFLRPHGCFYTHHPKYKIKRAYYRFLASWPSLAPVSIIPHFVNSHLAEVSRDWIYDPQNWDLYSNPPDVTKSTLLSEKIRIEARGRKIIAAIGGLNRFKGFEYFAAIAASLGTDSDSYFFVACGPLAHDCHNEAKSIEEAGGLVVGEFISDADIWALYGLSKAIWACYPALNDQASGIFGRAVQLGVPVIVRAGSFNAVQAERMGAPSLRIPFGAPEEAVNLLKSGGLSAKTPDWNLVGKLKSESLERLARLL